MEIQAETERNPLRILVNEEKPLDQWFELLYHQRAVLYPETKVPILRQQKSRVETTAISLRALAIGWSDHF